MKSRKWLRSAVFGLVALATLAALGTTLVSYQARQEWAQTKAELLERGEKLSLAELLPPENPSEPGFFDDPMWKELEAKPHDSDIRDAGRLGVLQEPLSQNEIDGLSREIPGIELPADATRIKAALAICNGEEISAARATVGLALLEPLRPLSEEVVELLKRPATRLQINYEEGFAASTRSLQAILALARLLSARACFEIELGQAANAKNDVIAVLGLADTSKKDPLLIYHTVERVVASLAYAAIEQGIASHLWSEEQLLAFEKLLRPRTKLESIAIILRGERATLNSTVERLTQSKQQRFIYGMLDPSEASRVPIGLLELVSPSAQASYNRRTQACIDGIELNGGAGFSPSLISQTLVEDSLFSKYLRPLSRLGLELLQDAVIRMANDCERARLLTIACALERYRIETGAYPALLEALVPHYLEKLPKAVFQGQTIRYRESGGKFMLWTPGWNEVDDMGAEPPKDLRSGDWVCQPNWSNG